MSHIFILESNDSNNLMELASIVANINRASPDELSRVDIEEWRLINESLNKVKDGVTTASPWVMASAEDVNTALKIASDMLESKKAQLTPDNALQEILIKIREDFPGSLAHQAMVLEYVSTGLQQLNINPTTLENSLLENIHCMGSDFTK